MSEAAVLGHLLDCYDTTYRALGESAPLLADDAYVIRVYETGRAMGEVALAFRELLSETPARPLSAISEVVVGALAADASGAMVLYAVASLVGPRLLVSLRDARDAGVLAETARLASEFASARTIQEILAIGEVAARGPAIEDPGWQREARALADHLEGAGYAESFGLSR